MNEEKKKRNTENVRIKLEVINLVREDKKVTGVPVGKFFELAAIDKLNKNKTNGQF